MQVIWSGMDTTVRFILHYLGFFNLIFSVIIVFFRRRNPKSVWAWLLLLYSLPILGFLFYLLFGTDMRKRRMFKLKGMEDRVSEIAGRQESMLRKPGAASDDPWPKAQEAYRDLALYNLDTMEAMLTDDNDVDIFTDGNDKFRALIEDLKRAERFIHIQYYIIRDDVVFATIRSVLEKKAAEGVEVRILYDAMGCRFVPSHFWKKLRMAGIETAEFFPAFLKKLHLRINYRNHRKIVVIDNRIAYVGGFNVGKEYVGLEKRFGFWRDTHMRICGNAVRSLELRFVLDWNYAAGQNLFLNEKYFEGATLGQRDNCRIQVISSGPDSKEQTIRDNYVRLIHKAEREIYIQTPYFIPDEAMFEALLVAVHSGIDVHIMIPCKPDHPFVYWATYSYIGDLVMAGANCYTYDRGFLHAKGLVVDRKVFCYGTANMDIRSFALNFEVNVVVYDEKKAEEMTELFRKDLEYCTRITRDAYAERSVWLRIKEQTSRLLSPLL